jgi:hypothetical protein
LLLYEICGLSGGENSDCDLEWHRAVLQEVTNVSQKHTAYKFTWGYNPEDHKQNRFSAI